MIALNEFLTILRQVGFSISPAEAVEVHKILVDAESANEIRLGTQMLVAKSKQEQDLFSFIWKLYFKNIGRSGLDDTGKHYDMKHFDEKDAETPDFQILMDGIASLEDFEHLGSQYSMEYLQDLPVQPQGNLDADYCPNPTPISAGIVGSNDPSVSLIRFASDLKGPARQMLQGNYENAAAIFLRYLLANQPNLEELGVRRSQATAEITEMLEFAAPNHADDLVDRLDKQIDDMLKKRLADAINVQIRGQNALKIQQLEHLPLISLKSSPELTMALQQLGKKLATRRKLQAGKRKIHLGRTIRANIQHGGTPLKLKYQQKQLDKPKLTILTDVSSSTLAATRLFLTIIWHAKTVFADIRFFEFIANMIDVTNELKKAQSADLAMKDAIAKWERINRGKQNSDYYMAFRTFEKLRDRKFSSKETVVLLGDLRDWLGPWQENQPRSAGVMGRIAKQVKRFIVLNPEDMSLWNTGDSIVEHVQKQGIEVYEATTLQQMIDVMLKL